jgi:pyruvate/2-oxoglutarate/acetoin dehydrogenase E1 component
VTAIDIPMPYAKNLEETVVPNADTIAKAVRKAISFK